MRSSHYRDSCFSLLLFILLLSTPQSNAQNASAATNPSEVRALNALFEKWDTQPVPLWNTTGDPCSGSAINGTEFEDPANNPAIKCDCSYANRTICHITQLRVYALNKRGVIPEEITGLKYLTFLKIDQNYFTGPLPTFIANLTALTLLSIAHNSFSGTIPKELGSLKELNMLSFGSNNFSGTLPPELGNLVKLEQIYINSCGVGGEIPATFANLRRMRIMWASDSPFTGKIPEFIGNWTLLTSLRFQGNSFEGPIPSSFAKLVSLESLRINDLSNVSSSLNFITNLKNLTDLSLRGALITDVIPSSIADIKNLQTLDLSFNNLTGRIPNTLFNMSSLTHLFLGNNSLSGNLPSVKNNNLQSIDLSYNRLSGSFPSWVAPSIQLNLVANNFNFDRSNVSLLPGLNCLQRTFPCNRGTPRYANFSIKCGSSDMRANDGTLYEADNSTLGPASFSVSSSEKWGVSNVGLFYDRSGASYVDNTLSQILNTDTPELFQTSRVSAGSLRYYGLGLDNGPYTISLMFAEIDFQSRSSQTWQSLGRRVFDIYIQGILEWKDFDITKEANGVERAVQRNIIVNVTENYLEIHLYWAGKGTCCIPVQGSYGPAISALKAVSNFTSSVSGLPPTQLSKNNRTGLIVGLTVAAAAIVCFILIACAVYYKLKKSDADVDKDLAGIGPTFSYAELRTATEDFSPANKLGEGGFGSVYKGILLDGREIGVKQLSVASHQGKTQFVAEIAIISAVQHRNLVKLYGCCIEGSRRLLVYEYLENKSLDQALFGKSVLHLDWPTRYNICLGTARGLSYLHEESSPRIVHRDIKASNILLDGELCPKISDFGLAKLYDDKKTHISTRVAGTVGYLAPEYAMRGHLTEKADVFGFGVVILEVVSGRENTDTSLSAEKIYLLEWAWSCYENSRSLDIVDPLLEGFDENAALRFIHVALSCTQASPMSRPSMSRVISMLSGDIQISSVISKPSYLTDYDYNDITNSFQSEEGGTSISKDENRSETLTLATNGTDSLVGEGR
ncbi:hypothetical protein QQ045_021978 [Rhodiola kirilowii]